MRNYIILNGVNSNTITGLLISKLPPITKPKIRTQTEEIDGRDGDIVTKLGYSAYDKEIEIGLYGNFDINEVIAYFNTEGTIVFSNEADKYYNYQILDQIDYEKLIRFKTAKVKMHVQPFKYPLEETPVEINIQNVTSEGETTSLDNTAEAPLTLALKGNTSQDGTPTPEAPVEVNTVTGGQEINVVGKNLLNTNTFVKGRINSTTGQIEYASNTTDMTISNNNISFTVSQAWNSGIASDFIAVEQGDYNFTYSHDKEITMAIDTYTAQKNHVSRLLAYTQTGSPTTKSFTISDNSIKYIRVHFEVNTATSYNVSNMQIEKGSATDYEPYQSQSYELDLGKNLFKGTLYNGIINQGGTYISNVNRITNADSSTMKTFILKKGAYTLSIENIDACTIVIKNESGSVIQEFADSWKTLPYTFTTTNDGYFYFSAKKNNDSTLTPSDYKPMLNKGTTALPYEDNLEIELCKIGDYQDYIYKDNTKWFIKRQIEKIVLDGTQNITLAGGTPRRFNATYTTLGIDNIKSGANATETQKNYRMCDYFSYTSGQTTWGNYYLHNNWLVILDGESVISDANALKTWLSNNNTSIYYVLETPEDEEITDNTLIGQLNALENARSYDTTTNISQNTANKPFIINATAVQKGTDTGTVDNIGNIYAKPTIDIEGSGQVEIYLDGNQIFNVDLSTINECVIDTTNLEAYNPATTQLMNRQVTGDYSNFKINVGDNQVKVSGAVTKATISNYTRWL